MTTSNVTGCFDYRLRTISQRFIFYFTAFFIYFTGKNICIRTLQKYQVYLNIISKCKQTCR